MKLPEDQRPDWTEMRKRLYSKVSAPLRQIFIEDVQNDCACEIETYDIVDQDTTGCFYLAAPDRVEILHSCNKVNLPIIPDISDESIRLLLRTVCEKVSGVSNADTIPYVAMVHPNATPEQKALVDKQIYRSSDWKPDGIILADFVPEDGYYLFPEPEFFGALTMNIGGYGAFGMPRTVSKRYYAEGR